MRWVRGRWRERREVERDGSKEGRRERRWRSGERWRELRETDVRHGEGRGRWRERREKAGSEGRSVREREMLGKQGDVRREGRWGDGEGGGRGRE